MALENAYAQSPNSLTGPVPDVKGAPIEAGKYQMPPMEITADRAPSSPEAQAPMPQFSAEELDAFNELQGMSPEELELLKGLGEVQGPPEPVTSAAGGLRDVFLDVNKNEYYMMDGKKKKTISKEKAEDIARLNEFFNFPLGKPQSAENIAGNLTDFAAQGAAGVAGEIAGGVVGGAVGGPAGASVGAALGAGAGNVLGGYASDAAKLLMGMDKKEQRNSFLEFLFGAFGSGAGQAVSALKKSQANKSGVELEQRMRAALEGDVNQELATQTGVPLTSEQKFQTPITESLAKQTAQGDYGATAQMQIENLRAQQDNKVLSSFQNIKERINPALKEQPGSKINFQDAVADWISGQQAALGKIKNRAFDASGGKLFSTEPLENEIKRSINDIIPIYDDFGRPKLAEYGAKTEGELASRLPQVFELYAELSRVKNLKGTRNGVTLQEFDSLRDYIGQNARFGSRDASQAQRKLARIYRNAAEIESDYISRVLEPIDPGQAARLRELNKTYSQNIEAARDFEKLLKESPSDAARVLIDPKSPENINALKAILDEDQFNGLAEGLLSSLADKYTMAGEKSFKAQSLFNDFLKIDPKVRTELYGNNEKDIHALFRVASLIERSKVPINSVADGVGVKKFLMLAGKLKGFFNGKVGFIYDILKGNPTARDFLTGKIERMYSPDKLDALHYQTHSLSKEAEQLRSIPVRGAIQGGASVLPRSPVQQTK